MLPAAADLNGYDVFEFSEGGPAWQVLRRGRGPAVLLLHELSGATPRFIALANRLADGDCSIYAPIMFGSLGRRSALMNFFTLLHSGEVEFWRGRRTSPIVGRLRTLCHTISDRHGGDGIGVFGLGCSANFSIALVGEPCVGAVVISAPPLPQCFTTELSLSEIDLEAAKARAAGGVDIMG